MSFTKEDLDYHTTTKSQCHDAPITQERYRHDKRLNDEQMQKILNSANQGNDEPYHQVTFPYVCSECDQKCKVYNETKGVRWT